MESVKHRRPNGGKTPTGELIPDTSTWREIKGCTVAPTRSQDLTTVSRDGEVLSWDVFTHSPEDIQRGDLVEIRGSVFKVAQTPFQWETMRRRMRIIRPGVRFTGTRKEG